MGLAHDIGAGVMSSFFVSPFMTVIDSAVMKSQFEKTSLIRAIKNTIHGFVKGEMKWRRPLTIMTGVYASTYVTANTIEHLCKTHEIGHRIPTTLCTSFVNMTAICYKERVYANLYGTPSTTFPRLSYALFAVRDTLTITSSFVLKHDVKTYLQARCCFSHTGADATASFLIPMAAQVVSTPLHILALDWHQRPMRTARWDIIKKQYASVCLGRILRVIPAFGVGGFVNDVLKERI